MVNEDFEDGDIELKDGYTEYQERLELEKMKELHLDADNRISLIVNVADLYGTEFEEFARKVYESQEENDTVCLSVLAQNYNDDLSEVIEKAEQAWHEGYIEVIFE
jgi:tRNA A37 N6-isopentenylltransferase MiaA